MSYKVGVSFELEIQDPDLVQANLKDRKLVLKDLADEIVSCYYVGDMEGTIYLFQEGSGAYYWDTDPLGFEGALMVVKYRIVQVDVTVS